MKHIFIISKVSGKGDALNYIPFIEEITKKHQLEYEIIITEYKGHAKEIAHSYTKEDDVALYIVGGDGSLHEVINGICEDVPLGILPAGSGNDFYRLMKKGKIKKEKLVEDTIFAPIKRIDTAQRDDLSFLNVTSFGMDADVASDASDYIRRTFLRNKSAYLLAIAKNILLPKYHHYKIIVDGVCYEDDYYIVACLNGRYYGNGVPACPVASVQDGFLDLCLVPKVNILKVYLFLIRYLFGAHLNTKEFIHIPAKEVEIFCDDTITVESDGEAEKTNHCFIKIKEGTLSLKVPSYLNIIS